jgi:hypothetical protein
MKYVYLLAACILWLWWRNYESPHVPYRCDAGEELPHQEQPDHAQNPEHPFFLEWQRAEEERRIDQWIRRALDK